MFRVLPPAVVTRMTCLGLSKINVLCRNVPDHLNHGFRKCTRFCHNELTRCGVYVQNMDHLEGVI